MAIKQESDQIMTWALLLQLVPCGQLVLAWSMRPPGCSNRRNEALPRRHSRCIGRGFPVRQGRNHGSPQAPAPRDEEVTAATGRNRSWETGAQISLKRYVKQLCNFKIVSTVRDSFAYSTHGACLVLLLMAWRLCAASTITVEQFFFFLIKPLLQTPKVCIQTTCMSHFFVVWFYSVPIKQRSSFLIRSIVKTEELIVRELFRDRHVACRIRTAGEAIVYLYEAMFRMDYLCAAIYIHQLYRVKRDNICNLILLLYKQNQLGKVIITLQKSRLMSFLIRSYLIFRLLCSFSSFCIS